MAASGCEVVSNSTPDTLVRVINASSNAGAVDVYAGSTEIATNVGAPTITNYAFMTPGSATLSVHPTGSKTIIAQVNGSFLSSQQHSLYLTNVGAGFQAALLTDQNTAPTAGNFAVRFLQQAPITGAVDIYFIPDGTQLTASKPVLTDCLPGTISAYLGIPAGTWDLVVVPTGVKTLTGAYVSQPTVYVGGQVRTNLIVDQTFEPTPPVSVITGDDLN